MCVLARLCVCVCARARLCVYVYVYVAPQNLEEGSRRRFEALHDIMCSASPEQVP